MYKVETQDTMSEGDALNETEWMDQNSLLNEKEEATQIFFGDEICIKSDNIESQQYMFSDGFYPSCLKRVDFSKLKEIHVDIAGAVLEICHPGRFASAQSTSDNKNQGFFSALQQQGIIQSFIPSQKKQQQDTWNYSSKSQSNGSGMMIISKKGNDEGRQSILGRKETSENVSDQKVGGGENDENEEIFLNEVLNEGSDNRTSLTFHQSFVLKHKRSQKYLGLIEDDLEHFSLVLSSEPSLFKISPCFKSQIVQSKCVFYSQLINIQAAPFGINSNKDIFLVLEDILQFQQNSLEQADVQMRQKFSSYSSFFGDYFFSPNQRTTFHFEQYRSTMNSLSQSDTNESENDSRSVQQLPLHFGDVVKIFHIETDSFLQYSNQSLDNFKQSYDKNKSASQKVNSNNFFFKVSNFKQFLGRQQQEDFHHENEEEEVFFCNASQECVFNDSYTLWKIMNPFQLLDGSVVEWGQNIVLKCLSQDLFLHIEIDNETNQSQTKLKESISEQEDCFFHLQEEQLLNQQGNEWQVGRFGMEMQGGDVMYSSLCRLINSKSGFTLSTNYQNEVAVFQDIKQKNSNQILQQKEPSLTQSVAAPQVKSNEIKMHNGSIQDQQLREDKRILVLKENSSLGDVTKFLNVDMEELIQNNYIVSTLDIMQAAIPLIEKYVKISESKEQSKTFQLTNPYFLEFIDLLKLSIQHQIKFLLDVNPEEQIKFDETIFRRHKVNTAKQDLANQGGILEYSINILNAMWSHEDEQRVYDILQATKFTRETEFKDRIESKDQPEFQSFILSTGKKRRESQIKSFQSQIDMKDGEIELYVMFRRLSFLVYFLIITLCKNNSNNSQKTFNYFTIFKNHVGYSVGATRAISSILKNNEKLLSSIHQKNYTQDQQLEQNVSQNMFKAQRKTTTSAPQDLITSSSPQIFKKQNTLVHVFLRKYLQMFNHSKKYWTNYLDVMNIMCICKDQALNINQLLIGHELLSKINISVYEETHKAFIDIQCLNDKIMVRSIGKVRELSEFIKEERDQETKAFSTPYEFLLKQLSLYSNLCVGRNYQNKALLEKNITATALIKYITSEELAIDLRANLLSLLINLHFDSCPRKEIQRPCYTQQLNLNRDSLSEETINNKGLINYVNQKQVPSNDATFNSESNTINQPFISYRQTKQTVTENNDKKEIRDPSRSTPSGDILRNDSEEKGAHTSNSILISESGQDNGSFRNDSFGNSSFGSLLQKDTMDCIQQLKIFVVNFLKQSIFTTTGQLKCDMLSFNVVKLARMMITFNCFHENDIEFIEVIEALIVILQFDNKSSPYEKLKNIFQKDPASIKNREEREKCQLMINQEVLQTLLYYQSFIVDINLKSLLEFISSVILTQPNLDQNKMDFDLHIKSLVQTKLKIYLPKLNSTSFDKGRRVEQEEGLSQNRQTINIRETNNANPSNENRVSGESDNRTSQSNVNGVKLKNFDSLAKGNCFLNIILKNFVHIGDSDLQTSHLILKILFQYFSQRQNMIKSLKRLQILTSEEDLAIFTYTQQLSAKIGFIQETQELWLKGDEKLKQNIAFNDIKVVMEQLNLAFFQEIKYNNSQHCFTSNQSLEQMANTGKVSFGRQHMMRNLEVYDHIIKILSEGNVMMKDIHKKSESDQFDFTLLKEEVNKLYRHCYMFLNSFVKENKENQKILSNYFDIFLENAGESDFGQYKLLSQIVKDNTKICKNLPAEVIKQYIEKVYSVKPENKLYLLDVLYFFENLICQTNDPSHENIDKVINCLFESNQFVNFFKLKQTNFKHFSFPNQSQMQMSQVQSLPQNRYFEFDCQQDVLDQLANSSDSNTLLKSMTKEELPFVYLKKALDISCLILTNCLNPTNFRYLFSKLITIDSIYKLLESDDIFSKVNASTILFHTIKPFLMKFMRLIWLVNEKNSQKLSNNEYLINFLYKEASKFKNINEDILDQLNAAMCSDTPIEKYFSIVKIGKEIETGDNYELQIQKDNFLTKKRRVQEEEENKQSSDDIIFYSTKLKKMNPNLVYVDAQSVPEVLHDVIMELKTDYLDYLFKHLLPFVIDTFKCFIIYNSQQENITARKDYEAFSTFARELVAFCQYKVNPSYFKKESSWVSNTLIEFQEIFKIKLHIRLDLHENHDFDNYPYQDEGQKGGIAQKKRIIRDSRLQRITEPFFEEILNYTNSKRYNQQVTQISLHLLNSEFVREELLQKERDHLIQALRVGDREKSLSLTNIVKKIVNFVKNAVDDLEREEGIIQNDDEILIQSIQLLSDIIDSCIRQEERSYMQTLLNQIGLIKVIVKFFCLKQDNNKNSRLFRSFLDLSIRLLQSGSGSNPEIQESFYQKITQSSMQSENLFSKIAEEFKIEMQYRTYCQQDMSLKIDTECKSINFSYSLHEKFSFQQLLQFIQLLTANSFSKLQKYLRSQQKSRTNYDILFLLVDLVESYIGGQENIIKLGEGFTGFVTDANTCSKIVMALETIILCIQGPCMENQIEIAQSKFLDICNSVLRLDDGYEQFQKIEKNLMDLENSKDNQNTITRQLFTNNVERKVKEFITAVSHQQKYLLEEVYELSPSFSRNLSDQFYLDHSINYGVWMLSSIKYKFICCLESLLDGENKLITSRMIATIQPSILKTNLGWIYEKYEALYQNQEHYDQELLEIKDVKVIAEELKPQESHNKLILSLRSSLIIRSGFVLFKLLRHILNQLNNNDVELIYSAIAKHQAEILQKQSKKNIFYQLLSLAKDFLKCFQSFFAYLKKKENLSLLVPKNKGGFNQDRMKKKAVNFFSKYSASIEIVSDDKLIRVTFPKYPHCFRLTNSLKYKVTQRIDIYSPHSKLESLVQQALPFIERLKFEQKFKAQLENNNLIAILANNLDLWKNLSYFVCILQNIAVLFTQHRSADESIFTFNFIGEDNNLQLAFQILQISLASLVFFFFLLKKVPLINKKTQDKIAHIERQKFLIEEQSMPQVLFSRNSVSPSQRFLEFKIKAWLFLNDEELIYFLIYLTFALLGMFNVFFLAILLFDIFWRFPALWNVLHAVWRPRKSILLTIFLFLICTYIFSLISYYFFQDRFEHLCDSLLTCFSVIFDYMYKNDGGITSFFSPDGHDVFMDYYGVNYKLNWGSLWDFAYFFIVITLLFSIMSGIIIDTFGLLRDEEDERNKNKKDFCLICSIDRATIDKLSALNQGYQHHIDVEHNLWNYIFFISYLKEKDVNHFLGIEKEILQKLENNDISWFPLNRSLSLSDLKDQNEELENISERIGYLETKFLRAFEILLKTQKSTNEKIQKIDESIKQQQQLQSQTSNNINSSKYLLSKTSQNLLKSKNKFQRSPFSFHSGDANSNPDQQEEKPMTIGRITEEIMLFDDNESPIHSKKEGDNKKHTQNKDTPKDD